MLTQLCSGVAAGTLLHGLTVHSAFEIRVIDDDHQGRNQYQGELTDEQIYHLRQVLVVLDLDMDYGLINNNLLMAEQFHNIDGQLNEVVPLGVFLDEFSMIPADMLGQVYLI